VFQFKDIIGQEEVKTSLINQINSGKLHHAHLFLGKMGFGTFQLAMAFIKYIYCHDKKENDSCGECANCLKVSKLNHIDIHFTLPSFNKDDLSKTLLPNFREIVEEKNALFDLKDWIDFNKEKNAKIRSAECDIILHDMGLSSYEDGYKTQIIWMAESLEKESNKILKILEEPNPQTLFILIAESSDRLLPTILSRCNIHKILPLKNNQVTTYLNSSPEAQPTETVNRAVHFSDGDLIEAERYMVDEDSEFPLEANLINYLRGLINFHERKFDNINKSIKQAELLAGQSKSNQKKFLDYFQYFLRQVVMIKFSQASQLNETLLKAAFHFANTLEIDQIEAWSQLVDKYHYAVDGNANVKISFVSLAIESGKIQNREEFELFVSQ
jgi:DNA polymerase III subunit delta'